MVVELQTHIDTTVFFTAPNPVLGIATYIEHGMQISIFLYSMLYDLSC